MGPGTLFYSQNSEISIDFSLKIANHLTRSEVCNLKYSNIFSPTIEQFFIFFIYFDFLEADSKQDPDRGSHHDCYFGCCCSRSTVSD
jgi:hypothetical protein